MMNGSPLQASQPLCPWADTSLHAIEYWGTQQGLFPKCRTRLELINLATSSLVDTARCSLKFTAVVLRLPLGRTTLAEAGSHLSYGTKLLIATPCALLAGLWEPEKALSTYRWLNLSTRGRD